MLFSLSVLIFLSFSFSRLFAGQKPPTVFNTYDGSAPGGRALAMGNAFCAVGEDPSAIYFNSAGLAGIKKQIVGVSVEATRQSELTADEIYGSEMLRNKNFMFIALTGPTGAFSWRPLADATVENKNGADWQKTEVKVDAYTLSASHTYNEHFDAGINVSFLSGRIAESAVTSSIPSANIANGYGFNVDLGAIYRVAPEFRIGANLQNLAGFMWWDDYDPDQLPFTVRTGFAFQLSQLLTFASDWEKRFYRNNDDASKPVVHFGLEQLLLRALALRIGAYGQELNDKKTMHMTAGLGYQMNSYSLSLSGEKYQVNNADVYRYLFSLDLPL